MVFSSIDTQANTCENITYGDNSKGKVIGLGTVPITNDTLINNVLFVDPLGYNLLSVSQLCKMGFNCLFTDKM